MTKFVPTHINAFYADLAAAKQDAAVAQQKVTLLEEQITAQGHPLPNKDGTFPEPKQEDTASSNDVSAAEVAPKKKKAKRAKKVASTPLPEEVSTDFTASSTEKDK